MNGLTQLLLTRVGPTLPLFVTNSAEQANLAHTVIQQLRIGLIAPTLIAKELIHFIERTSLGLGDKERDIQRAEGAHYAEEDVHTVRRCGDETGCGHSDGKVVEPVGGRANRDALCAQAQWEHLCDDDPRAGTPREAEADGEDPDEDNSGPTRGAVSGPVVLALCNDARDDKLAEAHDNCANDECRFAAPLVDVEHGGDGREKHDDTDDTRSEERSRSTV